MLDIFRLSLADQRDQIVFGEDYKSKKYGCGLRRFHELTISQIDQLEEAGIIDKRDAQNDSPTAGEIIEFLRERKTDGWYAHGYCIGPDRDDFRITFEGVGKKTAPSQQDIIDFAMMFRFADEFDISNDGVRCWYD